MNEDEDQEPAIDHLLMVAWGVIANAGGGDWTKETKEWQRAAREWRDLFHQHLKTQQRCPSCDHTLDMHKREGCWYTVTTGLPGENLVCPCTIPVPAGPEPVSRDNSSTGQLEVVSGTPLSGEDFELKLTTDQVSLIAWALQSWVNNLSPYAWSYKPSQQLAAAFAALSGDH